MKGVTLKQPGISSVLEQIKDEEAKKEKLLADGSLKINMTFKNKKEKILWLSNELNRELNAEGDDGRTTTGDGRDSHSPESP